MSTFGKPAGPLGSLVLLVGVVKSPATIVTERIFKDNHSVDSVTCLFPTFSLRPYTMEITGTFFFPDLAFFLLDPGPEEREYICDYYLTWH